MSGQTPARPVPRFGDAGDAYRAYRPTYPQGLFDVVIAAAPEPRRRAVDLGAGTGLSALPLCEAFDEVIGVEPDPAMASAMLGRSPRLTVQAGRSEEHDEAAGSVDLVTCANAFYWMDGPVVASRVATWLRPGGVLAVWRYRLPRAPDAMQALVLEELAGPWAPFVHARLLDPDYSRRSIAESGAFDPVDASRVANVVDLEVRALVGFYRSASFSAAYLAQLAPDARAAYLADFEARLAATSAERVVPVDFGLDLVVARKRSVAGDAAP